IDVEEKPKEPKSNYAVVGLYMYDADAATLAANLRPSGRGEFEITDLNRTYLEKKRLKLVQLGRGSAWFDAGTHEALLDTANFIATIEKRQGLKVACLEEVAYRMGFIDEKHLKKLADAMKNPDYQRYLMDVLEQRPVDGSPHPR
ncbi:MAG TPA: sugar phosphate nucleotidyltransferase, partial [Candidatus Thermoplasmatota archaeon]